MKFTYLTIGLLAALTTATPISDPEKYPEDYASGHVTGELAPQSVSAPIKERALFKRSNVDFTFFSSGDCTGQGFEVTATGSGQRNDLGGAQHSVKVNQLTNGWHLTLYSGKQQSGVVTRFFSSNVGEACWTGSWQSWGVFSS